VFQRRGLDYQGYVNVVSIKTTMEVNGGRMVTFVETRSQVAEAKM
jgi:hypothetical protein